eukprot:TRINITY_DN14365_c0_g1_i1.p1 TRINITY_DN14365_c0_g1~~TRINITY_DN14365_c0_g1_i1.p1  ORF type:complete len:1176 (+),score=157.13 TRINITY_DN14365_c0_g1_i1:52-3579(+)
MRPLREVSALRTEPARETNVHSSNSSHEGGGGDVAPLMNGYKWRFFFRRWPETLLGGVRVVGAPPVAVLLQFVILLLPLAVNIPLCIAASNAFDSQRYSSFAGLTVAAAVVAFLVPLVHHSVRRFSGRTGSSTVDAVDALVRALEGEDDAVESAETCKEAWDVLAQPLSAFRIVAQSAGAALIVALGMVAFARLADNPSVHSSFRTTLRVYGWFVVALAQFPLSFRAPAEPNAYQPTEEAFSAFGRALHVLCIFLLDVAIVRPLNVETPAHFAAFCAFPGLWAFGVLPEPHSGILWVMEHGVGLLGGSPAASDFRLTVLFSANVVAAVLVGITMHYASVFASGLLGIGLGLALGVSRHVPLGRRLMRNNQVMPTRNLAFQSELVDQAKPQVKIDAHSNAVRRMTPDVNGSDKHSDAGSISEEQSAANARSVTSHRDENESSSAANPSALAASIRTLNSTGNIARPAERNITTFSALQLVVSIGIVLAFVSAAIAMGKKHPTPTPKWTKDARLILDIIALALLVPPFLSSTRHRVYLFRVLPNPWYRSVATTNRSYGNTETTGGGSAKTVGWVNYVLVIALCCLHSAGEAETAATSDHHVLEAIAVVHFYQLMWRRPSTALLALAATAWLQRVNQDGWGTSVRPYTRLLVASLVIDRASLLLLRLQFIGVSVWGVLMHAKQRFEGWAGVLTLELTLCLPAACAVIAAATALGWPLFPLWGVPVFLIGFPRPLRMWPTGAVRNSPSADTPLYASMGQAMADALGAAFNCGALRAVPGAFFLLRCDQYMALAEVVEQSPLATVLLVKGLELQMTSCHALEASHVDHLMDRAFGEEQGSATGEYTQRALGSPLSEALLPVTQVEAVGYSISDVSLAGLLDHPDVLDTIRILTCQAIVWTLSRAEAEFRHFLVDELQQLEGEALPALGDDLSVAWLRYVQGGEDASQTTALSPMPSYGSSTSTKAGAVVKGSVLSRDFLHRASTQATRVMLVAGLQHPTMLWISEWFGTAGARDCERLANTPIMRQALVRAVQYGTRLAFEQATLGTEFDNAGLLERLTEFDAEWHMGTEASEQWNLALHQGTTHLFTVVSAGSGQGYRAKWLSRKPLEFQVGELNGEVVRGLWSSLGLELLYFTNDDEERYSIQSHPQLLRNTCVHAAEPPLGYPVYSQLFTVATLPWN